jgi:pimeloyl-ACP methyl ester carboxylesterase
MTSVVLVHGAWHGAWCFDPVLEALAARGIDAVAVDLPGHGDDPGPLGDLHTDAARVREVLDGLDGDCVLLGHSYGGAVITEAGVHPAVRHLVFLCAFALDAGESCMAAAVREAEELELSWGEGPNLADGIEAHDDGTSTVTREIAAQCFFHDCDPADAAAALDRLGPQPMVTLADEPRAVAWRERPSTYVVCTDDQAVPEALQRVMAKRCTSSVDLPTSHSPFLSAPEAVADLLADLARQERASDNPRLS